MLSVAYGKDTVEHFKTEVDRPPADVAKQAIPETTEMSEEAPLITPRTTYSCPSGWRCRAYSSKRCVEVFLPPGMVTILKHVTSSIYLNTFPVAEFNAFSFFFQV